MRLTSCILSLLLLAALTATANETLDVKVTKVDDDTLTLDAGSDQGLKVGLKGRVYYEITLGGEVKRIYIANITLTAVQPDESIAKIEKKTADIKPGHFAEIKSLQKGKGFLYVTSKPQGADIYLDGKTTREKTPVEMEVSAGSHTLEVSLKFYEPASKSVHVSADEVSRVEFSLVRGKGILTVRSKPLEVEVYLDEELKGNTPLTIKDIPAGEHTLELRKEGYTQRSETIQVLSGEPVVLQRILEVAKPATRIVTKEEIKPVKKAGAIFIESEPAEANIYLDGVLQKAKTPATIEDVVPGSHVLKLSRLEHQDWESQVMAEAGKTNRLSAKLIPIPQRPESPKPLERQKSTHQLKWRIISGVGVAATAVLVMALISREEGTSSSGGIIQLFQNYPNPAVGNIVSSEY